MNLENLLINLQNYCKKTNNRNKTLRRKNRNIKTNLKDCGTNEEYILLKNTLNDVYDKKENEINVRRKCGWYKLV